MWSQWPHTWPISAIRSNHRQRITSDTRDVFSPILGDIPKASSDGAFLARVMLIDMATLGWFGTGEEPLAFNETTLAVRQTMGARFSDRAPARFMGRAPRALNRRRR